MSTQALTTPAVATGRFSEQYAGKVTPLGNSKAIWFDAAFFEAHPEFQGEVRVTVLANGQVLLSASHPHSADDAEDEIDPTMLAFLQFLEGQITHQPEQIEALNAAQLTRIAALVEGVGFAN